MNQYMKVYIQTAVFCTIMFSYIMIEQNTAIWITVPVIFYTIAGILLSRVEQFK